MGSEVRSPRLPFAIGLESPVIGILDGLDGPSELVAERLGEELLNRNIELLREDHCQARINVVLSQS
jgi:hypothetical protein